MKYLFMFFVILANTNLYSQCILEGAWEGAIIINNNELKFNSRFISENGTYSGEIDIPQQFAKDLKISNIVCSADSIKFELAIGPGNTAQFSSVSIEGKNVEGLFSQRGFNTSFYMNKTSDKAELNSRKIERLPYNSEDIEITNNGLKLAGTLTFPKAAGKYPVLIMVTGSGAQNRDEEIYGFKIFKKISDSLTRAGYAVLRYDDRGIGGSEDKPERNSTSFDFADDALAWVKYLKTRKEIDPKKIGVFGHSEGGLIAPIVVSKSKDISFIVLMAPPAMSGEEILKMQLIAHLKASNTPQSTIDSASQDQSEIIEIIKTDKGWDTYLNKMKTAVKEQYEKLSDEQKKQITLADMESKAEIQLSIYKNSWWKTFIVTDARDYLSKTNVPVLALFGGLDTQVPADINASELRKALEKAKNKNFDVKIFTDANHLFQKAEKGTADEYMKLEHEFVPGYLDYIVKWLDKNIK